MTEDQEAKLDQALSRLADLDRKVDRMQANLVNVHLRPLRLGVRALLGPRKADVREGVSVELEGLDVEDGP